VQVKSYTGRRESSNSVNIVDAMSPFIPSISGGSLSSPIDTDMSHFETEVWLKVF
jgi:hypothetical protein